jgi:hypothetical protein
MLRLSTALLFACLPLTALASPVPKVVADEEKVRRPYGTPIDASGKCEFRFEPKRLTIQTAGRITGKDAFSPYVPQVVRKLSGDFDIRVKVASLTLPDDEAHHVGNQRRTAAGLFVTGGGRTVSVLRFNSYDPLAGFSPFVRMQGVLLEEADKTGARGMSIGNAPLKIPIWVRLARRAGVLPVSWGADGMEWFRQRPMKAPLPDEVTVGLFVAQTTEQTCQAEFEDYTVEAPPKD